MEEAGDQALCMVRRTLAGLPRYAVGEGFAVRWYERGDMETWLRVQRAAERINPITADLYRREFGEDEAALGQRQAFLCFGEQVVGTATAWFDQTFELGPSGRVHWVAVVPRFQGRGLSKPLLSAVCQRLVALGHERAYLNTSSSRLAALRLYRGFGFEAYARSSAEARTWARLELD